MTKKLFVLATVIMTMLVAVLSWVQADDPDESLPQSVFVARVYYDTIAELEQLADLDLHEFNNLAEKYVLVSMDSAIYYQLQRDGWQVAVDEAATADFIMPFFGGYRTVAELQADLQTINATYPELTELVVYGESYCQEQGGCITLGGQSQPGYDLMALRITNEAITGTSTISDTAIISGTKPVFFLMANIHSREITTPELAMRMIDWLLENYGTDADATWMVDWHETWIVPVVNPDGHWLTVLGTLPPYNGNPFYQRKNANRSNGCTTWPPNSSSQYGIDLNRNHTFAWNTGGSSGTPCSQTYRGPSAGSEPEVWQLEALVSALIPDQRGPNPNDAAPPDTTGLFITMHSYSELVLWPWGNVTTPAPNYSGLKAIGDKFATYNGYTSCQPSVCLYSTSGTSDDWAYGVLGVPAYTFEVGTSFMPPYGQVDSIQWPDNGPALQYATRIARTPYMLALGPDSLNVTAVSEGSTLTITAVINDVYNGNRPITAAVYAIDTPYWVSGTITGTLQATDGTFNSAIEAVNAVVDVSHLENGQHILFVRGQDNQGNWGPVSAAFFEVAHSGAVASLQKAVSATAVAVGEPFTYTLSHQLSLSDTHTYTTTIYDTLPAGLAVLTDTIAVEGVSETAVYLPDTHQIQLNSSGTFTDSQAITITFQAVALTAAQGLTLTNSFVSQNSVNDIPLTNQTSNATSTYVYPLTTLLTKTVSASVADPGDVLTYTLQHALHLTGTHSYSTAITDTLPAGLVVLTDTIAVEGVAETAVYLPDSHQIQLNSSGSFTHSQAITITFQVSVTVAAQGQSVVNSFTSANSINDYQLATVTSNAVTTAVGFSPASSLFTKTVSADIAQPGDVITYTLSHALSLSSTHSYTLSLEDLLPTAVTLLTPTLQLNGQPAPHLYDPIAHAIHYSASGIFTDTLSLLIEFQVQISAETADGDLISNSATISGTVDLDDLIPQTSEAITQIEQEEVPPSYSIFIPFIQKED